MELNNTRFGARSNELDKYLFVGIRKYNSDPTNQMVFNQVVLIFFL